jgi:2,3-bisphosphoglycerate-independent phosphoglycerate mutase
MIATPIPRPIVLCILDGWGLRRERDGNSIALALTPTWNRLLASCPTGQMEASERDVGLPRGQMGNSEVGHMNLGAGRVVMQELPRIDQAVEDGSLAENPALRRFIAALLASGGTCHLMGLLSPGGVHSHQAHIAALAKIVGAAGVPVAIHTFMDGRDTPPKSALGFLETFLPEIGEASVATVSGRFYAMDRDNRWDRISAAYRAIAAAQGDRAANPMDAITTAYERGETDEFIRPTIIGSYAGMRDGDGLLMANFRADRAREILTALTEPDFDRFERGPAVRFAAMLGLVAYSVALSTRIGAIFPAETLTETLGDVVSAAGLRQLRIAETEKYAHVTYFFNGGDERVHKGEERILVPSPKVATYDLAPEMAAEEVTDRLIEAIRSERFDLIVVNYANPDMVGHTGIIEAAVKAVETVDHCLGRLVAAVEAAGGTLLITADHGNVEQMVDATTNAPHTAHTLNPVPVVLVNAPAEFGALRGGRLADVAPTLLELLRLPQPALMTGRSMLIQAHARQTASRAHGG